MDIDCVVVGAGVVGLAVARAIALSGQQVYLLEACERAGEGISSRNSGVIHAGMYYPPGSLKARCCVRGAALLYAFCQQYRVAHRRIGKLIVATDPQDRSELAALAQRADQNGVRVRWLEAAEAQRLEPQLQALAALESPDSGIVDVPEYVNALVGAIEAAGGTLIFRSQVRSVRIAPSGFQLQTADGDSLSCRTLVNAAGLGATALARSIEGLAPAHVPQLWYGQGHYYTLRGPAPFSRLIYPLPHSAGLGVHLGMDLSGRCRFGPDMRWINQPDYRFDDSQRQAFADSIRAWWPALRDADLSPDFVGVRPKLRGPGQASADFVVQGSQVHSVPGLVNLFGIESPGLTSSLALAEEVLRVLNDA